MLIQFTALIQRQRLSLFSLSLSLSLSLSHLEKNPDMLKYECIEKLESILAHPAYKALEEFHWQEAQDPETPCGKVCGDPDTYPKTYKDVLEVNGGDEDKAYEAFKTSLEEEMKAHFDALVTKDDNMVGL